MFSYKYFSYYMHFDHVFLFSHSSQSPPPYKPNFMFSLFKKHKIKLGLTVKQDTSKSSQQSRGINPYYFRDSGEAICEQTSNKVPRLQVLGWLELCQSPRGWLKTECVGCGIPTSGLVLSDMNAHCTFHQTLPQ